MEKTKVFCINAENEFELVKKINAEERKIFASQPMQKNDGTFICFVYY